MKKNNLMVFLFVFLAAITSSCKKTYTCKCETVFMTTEYTEFKSYPATAEKECKDKAVGLNNSCELE